MQFVKRDIVQRQSTSKCPFKQRSSPSCFKTTLTVPRWKRSILILTHWQTSPHYIDWTKKYRQLQAHLATAIAHVYAGFGCWQNVTYSARPRPYPLHYTVEASLPLETVRPKPIRRFSTTTSLPGCSGASCLCWKSGYLLRIGPGTFRGFAASSGAGPSVPRKWFTPCACVRTYVQRNQRVYEETGIAMIYVYEWNTPPVQEYGWESWLEL